MSDTQKTIEEMYTVGAHFGYSRTKRNPSVQQYIFTNKQRTDIIDLEKTNEQLNRALEFVKKLGEEKKQILLVGTKPEARSAIRSAGNSIPMPFVSLRWIGGTLTNFTQIRKRIDLLETLSSKRDKNELVFKTKKEKLMIERKIEKLDKNFGGIVSLKTFPAALFVIDAEAEKIAIQEAHDIHIPVIALANTDCTISNIEYPIVANDASVSSIEYFTAKIVAAYQGTV